MASLVFLLFSYVVLFSNLFSLVLSGGIVTYWGQNAAEGSLADACKTGIYGIINIGFVDRFGGGQESSLNLTGHCDPRPLLEVCPDLGVVEACIELSANSCTGLSADIKSCQGLGVKIHLSIGGPTGTYSLASSDDAKAFATYLWNNYLGGTSDSRPLGDAILDGIDFYIESGEGSLWADLARAINVLTSEKPFVLSASPRCSFTDSGFDNALIPGLFDYLWVRFYNNEECQYTNIGKFMNRWSSWRARAPEFPIFLGLPAAPEAGAPNGGYVSPDVLKAEILPRINIRTTPPSYGGIMVWNRFYDRQAGYSTAVKSSV